MLSSFNQSIALAGLAMLSVSLWTARVALTAQRRRLAATAIAAIEATVFAVVFSRLLTGLDNPYGIAGYAIGVAAGTALALKMDEALNPQLVKVDIVDPLGSHRLLDQLHARGWPTTTSPADGLTGPVTVISVTTDATRLQPLTDAIAANGAEAFWTITPIQRARPTSLPIGFVQTADVHRRRRRDQRTARLRRSRARIR
ncbi:MAG: DUF5698 domain-containing protein [Actinomycetota bacterium]